MLEIRQWHDKGLDEHTQLRDEASAKHFRFQSLSIYGTAALPLYAAVMIKWDPYPAQRDYPWLNLSDLQQTIVTEKKAGFGPAIIAATGSAANPVLAVVFEQLVSGAEHQLALTSGSSTDDGTIQGQLVKQRAAGKLLRWAASYGDSSNPRFAAVWHPQASEKILWNADGLLESSDVYQQRFDAQTSVWARPYFVTLNKSHQYLSAFAADEVGGYWARHGITSKQLSSEYDSWTKQKKWTPVCIQGGGDDAASARFTALFVEKEKPTARAFTAKGPVANAQIDAVIEKALRDSPLRHAALAIVHQKKLVYARGYTLAEPSWPLAEPTTRFRLASDSKTITALAIYQLIEQKKLDLEDHLQSILQLKTPSGGPPTDSRFGDIKIKHLLAHTSGLNTDAFRDGPAVRDAFIAAGQANKLPVSNDKTASYVASLPMVSAPGAAQAYSNCGYYMLGRVLRHKRNATDAVHAMSHLFDPLHIDRIRNATTLVKNQPANEARYQTALLSVYPSQMSDARPLVPDEYGTEQMEVLECAGGLSAAATDVARLIAILLDTDDNPALKRSTIVDMMNNAVATGAQTGHTRAGHGWDGAVSEGGGKFYAQKGGSLDSNHSVIQIDGDWGFTMLWAGEAGAATGWYPDYPDVMNIARAASWGAEDLFPTFGMPSL